MGRQPKVDRDILRKAFEKYIAEHDLPIVSEFAYQHGYTKKALYRIVEIKDLMELCITKKEAQLERLGMNGTIDKTMAIFSLKQLGWTDRATVEHSGGIDVVALTPAERDERIKELAARYGKT